MPQQSKKCTHFLYGAEGWGKYTTYSILYEFCTQYIVYISLVQPNRQLEAPSFRATGATPKINYQGSPKEHEGHPCTAGSGQLRRSG
jgi:hypothetical protein